MTTINSECINSLDDLVQKISCRDINDDSFKFIYLESDIEYHLSHINDCTDMPSLYYHYGSICGILAALSYFGCISLSEESFLKSELGDLVIRKKFKVDVNAGL